MLLLLCLLLECIQHARSAEADDACLSFGVLPRQHLASLLINCIAFLCVISTLPVPQAYVRVVGQDGNRTLPAAPSLLGAALPGTPPLGPLALLVAEPLDACQPLDIGTYAGACGWHTAPSPSKALLLCMRTLSPSVAALLLGVKCAEL